MEKLIKKLSKIKFNVSDGKTLTSADGFSVSYRLELHHFKIVEGSPFQVVVFVRYKDTHIMTYGCTTHEETSLFGEWFLTTKAAAYEMQMLEEDMTKSVGKAVLDSL